MTSVVVKVWEWDGKFHVHVANEISSIKELLMQWEDPYIITKSGSVVVPFNGLLELSYLSYHPHKAILHLLQTRREHLTPGGKTYRAFFI